LKSHASWPKKNISSTLLRFYCPVGLWCPLSARTNSIAFRNMFLVHGAWADAFWLVSADEDPPELLNAGTVPDGAPEAKRGFLPTRTSASPRPPVHHVRRADIRGYYLLQRIRCASHI